MLAFHHHLQTPKNALNHQQTLNAFLKQKKEKNKDWFWYLYGPSVGQWSGQSSLVWFWRMLTISCLTDWISLSAPGQTDRGETGGPPHAGGSEGLTEGQSLTSVSRPSLRLCTVSVEILRRDAGQSQSEWKVTRQRT